MKIFLAISVLLYALGLRDTSVQIENKVINSIHEPSKEVSLNLDADKKWRAPLKKIDLKEDLAKSFVLLDEDTGEVVLGKNYERPLPLASLTKLMTALVTLESFKPEDEILVPDQVKEIPPAVAGLPPGSSFYVKDLLPALLIPSGNDAAYTLASAYGEKEFVSKMNQTAQILGLNSFYFDDASGLSPKNQGSAKDVALLLRVVRSNPRLSQIIKTEESEITDVTGSKKLHLRTTNLTFSELPVSGVLGGKTGHIDEAGFNLALSVLELDGRTLTAVVLNAKESTREGAAKAIQSIISEVRGQKPNNREIKKVSKKR